MKNQLVYKALFGVLFFPLFLPLLSFSAENRPFPVYDNTLYRFKPDLTVYGLKPCYISGWEMFSDHWTADMDTTRGNEAASRSWARRLAGTEFDGPNGLVVPDIEHWDIRNEPGASQYIPYMNEIVDWMRDEVPSLVLGYWGQPPSADYWRSVQYNYGLYVRDTPEWTPWWDSAILQFETAYRQFQAENIRMRELADHCDVILPSAYTFYDDQLGWELNAIDQIRESRQYGKPVYVYLWPQFHDSSPRAFQYMEREYWRRQLELARREADGIMIWGGNLQNWDENAPWWQETLKFMRINDNTVNARGAGAVLDGITDDSQALQTIIDNFPPGGGRLIIDGTAAIGAQGLKIRNKVNVVIQGMGSAAGLKAVSLPQDSSTALGNVLVQIENSNDCFVDNLTIDMNQQKASGIGIINSYGVVIHGNNIKNISYDPTSPFLAGILGIGNSNNIYRGNRISDVPIGIRLLHSSPNSEELNPIVQHNKIFTTSQGDGISFNNTNGKIFHNWIKNAASNGISISNPSTRSRPPQLMVQENYVSHCEGHGIALVHVIGEPRLNQIAIEKNTLSENSKSGVNIIGASHSTLNGNTIHDNGRPTNPYPGINILDTQDIVIWDNLVHQNSNGQITGIRLSVEERVENTTVASTSLENITVRDNRFQNHAQDGFQLLSSGTGSFHNLTITNNKMWFNHRYGIFLGGQNRNGFNIRISRNEYHQNRILPIRNEFYALQQPLIETIDPDSSLAGGFTASYESLDGTENYRLQISQTPDFSTILNEYLSSTNQIDFTLTQLGSYYARLQGSSSLDGSTETTLWSPIHQFVFDQAAARPASETNFLPFKSVFTPKTEPLTISFNLGEAGPTTLTLYDRKGNELIKLLDSDMGAGSHSQEWDGKNASGDTVASGVYIAILKNNGKQRSTKIVVLR